MDAWIAFAGLIVVALIGGPVMWKLNQLDRKNTEQHGVAAAERLAVAQVVKAELAAAAVVQAERLTAINQSLGRVDGKVDTLGGLVGQHLAHHAHAITPHLPPTEPGSVIGTLISPQEPAA